MGLNMSAIEVITTASKWKCEVEFGCTFRATKQIVEPDGTRRLCCNTHTPPCSSTVTIGAAAIKCNKGQHISALHRQSLTLTNGVVVNLQWGPISAIESGEDDD